jgi:hypothetical protein
MGIALLILVVGSAFYRWVVLPAQRTAAREAIERRHTRAVAFIEGRLRGPVAVGLLEIGLRNVQIIGESIQIVANTKSAKTRESRLGVIDKCVQTLNGCGWDGLPTVTQDMVLHAVARSHAMAEVHTVVDQGSKYLAAAERAVKLPTKQRNIGQALAVLRAANASAWPAEAQAAHQAAVDRVLALQRTLSEAHHQPAREAR